MNYIDLCKIYYNFSHAFSYQHAHLILLLSLIHQLISPSPQETVVRNKAGITEMK